MTVLDLPDDILRLIFALIDTRDFLAVCSTCKSLQIYHRDAQFWKQAVSKTFRTPISPLLTESSRWYWLYRRLSSQTRLYTWGQGLKGALGHGVQPRVLRGIRGRRIPPIRHPAHEKVSTPWPTETHIPDAIGVIADMQCGGWSVAVLSSSGKLYASGSINSTNNMTVGQSSDNFTQLEYLTQSTSLISSFSAGRAHILALNEDHEILTWDRIDARGLKVHSRYGGKFNGRPSRVVAGWATSSAYIPDLGIVFWTPCVNDQSNDFDAKQVNEKIVPGTARIRQNGEIVAEVISHIVLENWIVWTNNKSEVWACYVADTRDADTEPRDPAVRLPCYSIQGDEVRDIQGSLRQFAVFTAGGRVMAGNTDYLQKCLASAQSNLNSTGLFEANIEAVKDFRPLDVPVLQHNGVIALQFGDWHYHALYADGTITSHGHEPQSCGSLGLGLSPGYGSCRGLYHTGHLSADSRLFRVADFKGRQVWFEPEKKEWLQYISRTWDSANLGQTGQDPRDVIAHTYRSEWIEQEGRHWNDGPAGLPPSHDRHAPSRQQPQPGVDHENSARQLVSNTADLQMQLNPYFTYAIGAAGWHSGALVLVDEEMVQQTVEKWIVRPQPQHARNEGPRMPGHFEEDDPAPYMAWIDRIPPMSEFADDDAAAGNHRDSSHLSRAAASSGIWRDGKPAIEELGLRALSAEPSNN